jgi:hypothetical protein
VGQPFPHTLKGRNPSAAGLVCRPGGKAGHTVRARGGSSSLDSFFVDGPRAGVEVS